MSNLRLTSSLSSSLSSNSAGAAGAAASGAGLVSSELSARGAHDAASLFSSLLDQLRGEANGSLASQTFSSALSGKSAASHASAQPSLSELGSTWKSFLDTWAGKLKGSGSGGSAAKPVAQAGPSSSGNASASSVAHNSGYAFSSCAVSRHTSAIANGSGPAPKAGANTSDGPNGPNGPNASHGAAHDPADAGTGSTGNTGGKSAAAAVVTGPGAGAGASAAVDAGATSEAELSGAGAGDTYGVASGLLTVGGGACEEAGGADATAQDRSGDSAASDAPSLGGLFAELQALMAQLQQRAQAMNGEGGGEGGGCASGTDACAADSAASSGDGAATAATAQLAQDVAAGLGTESDASQNYSAGAIAQGSAATAAGAGMGAGAALTDQGGSDALDMLKDLLALARTLDDRLGLSRGEQDGAASAAATPFEEIGHQLKADLSSMAEGLKAVLASSRPAADSRQEPARGRAESQTDGGAAFATDASPVLAPKDPGAELASKAFTMAEHMVAQINALSSAAGREAAQAQGKLASASAPIFGSVETLRALFGASSGNGGSGADGSGFDTGSFGRPSGGAASGSLANTGQAALAAGAEGAKGANPYSFASQLSSLRAASGGLTTLSSPAEQVIVNLHRTLASGDNRLSIQLNPAELGRIDIKIDMTSDGKAQGTVVASNPATLDMLQKDSRGLERALQEAGLQADPGSLSFSLGGQQQGQTSDQAARNGGFGAGGAGRGGAPSSGSGEEALPLPGDSLETWVISPNRVNVKI